MAGSSRYVRVEDIVGTHAIARRLGVAAPQVVGTWRRRDPDFPAPIATLGTALVWAWPDIEDWARRTGRLGNSPAPS